MKAKMRKIISWVIGWPAFVLAFAEYDDPRFWWVPFAAILTLVLIGWWNGTFNND